MRPALFLLLLSSVLACAAANDIPALTAKAAAGDVAAMHELGSAYYRGQGVPKDYALARRWFEAAAAQDYAPALNDLGNMYMEGAGVDRDPAAAAQLFSKGADLDDAISQFNLAGLYARGAGVSRNLVAAYKWLQVASLNGHPSANTTLQRFAPGMSAADIAEGQRQAVEFVFPRLLKKAQAGDRKAQSQLGMAYASGQLVPANDAEALKWLTKAAVQGDSESEYMVGQFYANGRGVTADYAQAAKWMRMAADRGDARAQATLGTFYDLGTGVPRNEAEAFKWSMKAAQQGSAEGQYNVAFAYANGKGVAKDDRRALEWYEKSSAQGYFNATNNAAWLLATSKDASVRNTSKAIQYAKQVVEVTSGRYPVYWHTLARCYYEAGQMSDAVASERKALELAPARDEYRVSLDQYTAIDKLQRRQR